jgi:hypothetical protein
MEEAGRLRIDNVVTGISHAATLHLSHSDGYPPIPRERVSEGLIHGWPRSHHQNQNVLPCLEHLNFWMRILEGLFSKLPEHFFIAAAQQVSQLHKLLPAVGHRRANQLL